MKCSQYRLAFYANQVERKSQWLQQPTVVTTTAEEISSRAKPVIQQIQKLPERITKLLAMLPQQEVHTLIY